MADPVTILVVTIITVFTLMLVWPYIRELFARYIIPFFRTRLGDGVADALATVIRWVDNPVAALRGQARQALKVFQYFVVGIKMRFTKLGADKIQETTEYHYRDPASKDVAEVVTERIIPWEKLPPDIRKRMIEQNQTTAEADLRSVLEHKAKDNGLELET